MKKKTILIITVVVISVLALGVYITIKILTTPEDLRASKFTAIYMVSGDIYFGKMSRLFGTKLESVWYLQRGVDQENNPQLSIAPFKKVVWSPVDEMKINMDQVLFWAKIKESSELAKALENPSAITPEYKQQNSRLQQELNQITPQEEDATSTKE